MVILLVSYLTNLTRTYSRIILCNEIKGTKETNDYVQWENMKRKQDCHQKEAETDATRKKRK